ncbi:RNA polymerase sigma factor [Chitinophaga sp. 30R24]|uniref:RNA polymerase sigma factor n=1 Tax=Chitinophaga sp. 30R24 TaxID=3248838 RepID=UPI003B9121A9
MERMPFEEEVLQRVIKGDELAFSNIYRHYHSSLYTYLLRFCKVPSLAEDLVHDVFLKVWEIRARINPQLSFSGYLYRIARNHVLKTITKLATDEQMREQVFLQLVHQDAGLTDLAVRAREYDRLFQEALSKMTTQRLKVFRLCRQEGHTYEEAAAMLGISRDAVKKHMVLSMRFIQEYIYLHGDILVAVFLLINLV